MSKSSSQKDIVVKSNRLNSALQNLSLAEIRIIQLAIVDARESGKGLDPSTPLTISATRYVEVFETTRQNAYMRIKETEDTLFNRRFSFIDEDGLLVKSRWLSQVRYLDNQGEIELSFTPAVVKGISRIDGAVDFFTQYSLQQTSGLDSAYSTRLYELLVQWKAAKKTPLFELETFRAQLGLQENEYSRMFDFKKRVLDMAVNEINKVTDLKVSYQQIKEGRSIIGFIFSVILKNKDQNLKDVKRDKNTLDMFTPMTDNQRHHFAKKLSKLHELSHLAKGDAGRDYDVFAEQIANELLDPERVKFYDKYLTQVGFKKLI